MKIIFLRSIEISTKVWVEFKLEASATTSPFQLQTLTWLMVYSRRGTELGVLYTSILQTRSL